MSTTSRSAPRYCGSPFFVAGHLWLGILNLLGSDYVRDGYFNPYQRAIGLRTLVYGFIGLILIHAFVKRYFSDRIALASLLILCFGSFVVWYVAVDGSFSHGTSMFTTTLFLFVWDRTRGDRTAWQWAALGGLAGLMSMTRWQNSLFMVVPAAESLLLYARAAWVGDWPRALGLVRHNASFLVFAILGFFPQMLVWKLERGGWFDLPEGEHAIYWAAPDIGRELFYPDRGLFSWTPVLAFAVVGVFVFARRHKLLGSALLLAFAAQVYISSTILSIGHGHGARKFMNCALIFCVGLAALLDLARRRPLMAPLTVGGALIVVNVFFMVDLQFTNLQQSGAVTFDRIIRSTSSRLGNPFSLPMNLWIARKYGSDLTLYERLGSQTFNNARIESRRGGGR